MIISPIFMFAPVPLTSERSPLAHAAALVRRRMAEEATWRDTPARGAEALKLAEKKASAKKVAEAVVA